MEVMKLFGSSGHGNGGLVKDAEFLQKEVDLCMRPQFFVACPKCFKDCMGSVERGSIFEFIRRHVFQHECTYGCIVRSPDLVSVRIGNWIGASQSPFKVLRYSASISDKGDALTPFNPVIFGKIEN